ncbi:MAG: methyltransferase domain-containing protein, partial [Solirubrobacteraceae bacterium]
MAQTAAANEEAIEAWDGPLFDRFVHFRHLLAGGLGVHGDEGLRVVAPVAGERALDIGCGFGDTAQQLAELVGADGSVLGVDAAPRFIQSAREEAAQAGVGNVRFEVVDVEAESVDGEFDLAFSRMGTMFFANPVAA